MTAAEVGCERVHGWVKQIWGEPIYGKSPGTRREVKGGRSTPDAALSTTQDKARRVTA
jgi:hypothetical protein